MAQSHAHAFGEVKSWTESGPSSSSSTSTEIDSSSQGHAEEDRLTLPPTSPGERPPRLRVGKEKAWKLRLDRLPAAGWDKAADVKHYRSPASPWAADSTYRKRGRSLNTPPTPRFTWAPGSDFPPIFDPDYPDGTPACLSPRSKAKRPRFPAQEGKLTVSEISQFGHVGTVETVWGEKLPEFGLCECGTLLVKGGQCPLHLRAATRGQVPTECTEED
ncbi:hypothetical protein FRB99_008142 [Tulasnella sp. 403]|nr:hypothetical protein FRB99_008142 [Tulasnella sp. 403]